MTGRVLPLLLLCLAAGCSTTDPKGSASPGSGGSASSGGTGQQSGGNGSINGTAPSFACDTAARPPAATLRRLTMSQYRNTLADFVAFATGSATETASVLAELAAPLGRLPQDRREPTSEDLHGSYRRLDQALQQLHVDSFYDLGVAAGAALTTPERLGSVVGACAIDQDAGNDAACLSEFIGRVGARALRRPLDAEEVSFYESVYGAGKAPSPAAYADVLGVMLNAPQMLYFVEHGATEVTGKAGVFELSGYELASRLSYQLWQTAPDAQLLSHAADGSLLDAQTYRAEVTRLLADPRAQAALSEFFGDFAKVEELPALDAKNNDPVFKAFAGSQLPSASLRQDMIDDVLGLLGYYTWQAPSGLRALFQSDLSFARSPELASLYGVPTWDGAGAPPSFPSGQRPGLLTRALFLSTGSPNTRPIMKGVFIRKNILCDGIPPPPPGANAKPPELEPGMTTRETVEELTETPGTVCAGCHATLINSLGFATENFDALGRFRAEQRFFDAAGNAAGSKPITTSGVPHVTDSDSSVAGASELMEQILASGKVEACLSRNFFRYTFARWENPDIDGCALENMRKSLENDGTVVDLVMAATLDGSFRQRAFE
ncbi:MAG TPA: DUF1592 domain-containing protein [Polyangiaceae bacterium]|nr:DUF1592 domain-containing protein [Polyangiaceae bacterium]